MRLLRVTSSTGRPTPAWAHRMPRSSNEGDSHAAVMVRVKISTGETGAVFTWAYPLASDAALDLQDWQIQSCTYNVDGWLLWTWDTNEQPEIWNAMSQGGVINPAPAPATRPDPCSP